jgi:Skp family chaperone for outer membrane proteins
VWDQEALPIKNPAMQHVVPQYGTILSRISKTLFDEYQKLRGTNQQIRYDLQIGQDALAKLAKLENHTSYQNSCLKEANDRAWNLEKQVTQLQTCSKLQYYDLESRL